jgi:hypothetical protein
MRCSRALLVEVNANVGKCTQYPVAVKSRPVEASIKTTIRPTNMPINSVTCLYEISLFTLHALPSLCQYYKQLFESFTRLFVYNYEHIAEVSVQYGYRQHGVLQLGNRYSPYFCIRLSKSSFV